MIILPVYLFTSLPVLNIVYVKTTQKRIDQITQTELSMNNSSKNLVVSPYVTNILIYIQRNIPKAKNPLGA